MRRQNNFTRVHMYVQTTYIHPVAASIFNVTLHNAMHSTHTHTHACAYTHACLCVHTHMLVRTHTRMLVRTHTRILMRTHTQCGRRCRKLMSGYASYIYSPHITLSASTNSSITTEYISACILTYVHAQTQLHMYTHPHPYTNTHTHTHTSLNAHCC